jgi:hypothetical protein
MSGLYIRRFMDRLQQLELKGSRDFICPLADAKNLHNDITRLLLDLEAVRNNANKGEETITVEIGGGDF